MFSPNYNDHNKTLPSNSANQKCIMHHHTHTHTFSFNIKYITGYGMVATTPGVGQFGEPFLHCGWLGRTLPFQHQPTTPPFWLGFLELGGLETGQHDPVGGVRGRLEKILEGPCCTCAQTQPFQLFFSNFSWFKVAVKRLKKANIISKTCPGDLMANSCNNKCFKHVKHANQPPFLPHQGWWPGALCPWRSKEQLSSAQRFHLGLHHCTAADADHGSFQ